MSALVPDDEIVGIVGIKRDLFKHYARAVSTDQTVYILHSLICKSTVEDLRKCAFSVALDRGIRLQVWGEWQDRTVMVAVTTDGELVPAECVDDCGDLKAADDA